MATSKINQADAQEWLESLQQVGEGWYRQVALAVRAGAHKSLNMERKEFAQAIGQKLVDSREAIIQLHNDGHSMAAIADVLSVTLRRVEYVLAEEGLITVTSKRQQMLDTGRLEPSRAVDRGDSPDENAVDRSDFADEAKTGEDDPVAEYNALAEEYNELLEAADEAKKEHRKEIKDLKVRIKELAEQAHDAARQAMLDAEAGLTDKERERARKEADAWAQEQGDKILAGLSHLLVGSITSALGEAVKGLKELTEKGHVTTAHLAEIEEAHAAFVEELNVARMSEQQA